MKSKWPAIQLGDILTERQEQPLADLLMTGEIRIVEKIGFNDGLIKYRSDCQTKTGMILIRPGDLVVSGINAAKGAIAICDEENKSSIAATIHYGSYIPDKTRVDIQYIWRLLRSNTFRDLLQEYVPGGIKTELKAKRLLPIPIPLPPLDEQRRIVARIEELAARIEEARELRRRAVEETNAIFRSEFKKIFEDISLEGRMFDVLLRKPKNGWSAKCDNDENGIPVLTLSAVTGFKYRDNQIKKTSENTNENCDYWLKPGDLLITRSNTPDLVGHAAIYSGVPAPCIYPDLMMRLEVDEKKASTKFVHTWLQSPVVRLYIQRVAKGSSPTMKKINQQSVMDIPFPSKLSIKDQLQIVAKNSLLESSLDALRCHQAETAAALAALLPAVLERAFRGEL